MKKRARDNTHFEEFLNERRLKKPHYEIQKESEEDEEDFDKNLPQVLEEKVRQRKKLLEKEMQEKEKQNRKKEEKSKKTLQKSKQRIFLPTQLILHLVERIMKQTISLLFLM